MMNHICPWKARFVGVSVNRRFQDSSYRVEQQSFLSIVHGGDCSAWVNASIEKYFVGIDVSDPRQHTLIHQDAFDAALLMPQHFQIRFEIDS